MVGWRRLVSSIACVGVAGLAESGQVVWGTGGVARGPRVASGARMLKWALIALSCLVLAQNARGDGGECPLPQIALPSSYAAVDATYSREIVNRLIVAAQHDAERARIDRLSVGADMAQLGADSESREVTSEVLSLAIRLRQLDCAVWSGRAGVADALYSAFIDDARVSLARLPTHAGPRLSLALVPPSAERAGPTARHRRLRISGALLIALGCAAIVAGVATGAYGEFGPGDLVRFGDLMTAGLLLGFQGGAFLGGGIALYLVGDHPSWVASRGSIIALAF